MSCFKGDESYRVYFDDVLDGSDASDEEAAPQDPSRSRRAWVDSHFDVLMELYRVFQHSGQSVFGNAFYQLGDFTDFVNLIYDKTFLEDADLLKRSVQRQHVSTLDPSSRRQHRLPVVQKANHCKPHGTCNEGVRQLCAAPRTG